MRLRVVCGLGLMMASFSPTKALSSVDLPALGRPRIQTNPEWKGIDYLRADRAGEFSRSNTSAIFSARFCAAAVSSLGAYQALSISTYLSGSSDSGLALRSSLLWQDMYPSTKPSCSALLEPFHQVPSKYPWRSRQPSPGAGRMALCTGMWP